MVMAVIAVCPCDNYKCGGCYECPEIKAWIEARKEMSVMATCGMCFHFKACYSVMVNAGITVSEEVLSSAKADGCPNFVASNYVAQVVPGRWDGQRCSVCNESYMDYADADSYPAIGEPKPNYCPNCGSKMDN